MKTLDDAVIELNGVLPSMPGAITKNGYCFDNGILWYQPEANYPSYQVSVADKFPQRAKELGFINGYRWGVKHKSDGKKPDLPDDVVIGIDESDYPANTVDSWVWSKVKLFMITDERYKPVDTSYLEKPALELVPEEESWYDYDNQNMIRNPYVGCICEVLYGAEWLAAEVIKNTHPTSNAFAVFYEKQLNNGSNLFWSGNARPLNYDRKDKAERKKVVDAAYGVVGSKGWLEMLYDNGFLKLPE